ncbi:MAG TPA: FAD-dependent oxidoreductase [Anaerolineaceae bacterium]
MPVVQKLPCRVEQITDHGDHVYTVDLASRRPLPRFRPGQFLHLALDSYDPSGFWPDSRVFSIASDPADRNHLRLSYSVKGAFTGRMERELVPGREVWVKLPYGQFEIDPTRDAILVAGGTGITAFTAFIASLRPGDSRQVILLYGARKPALFLYASLIRQKQAETASFSAVYFSEQPAPGMEDVQSGMLNLDALLGAASRLHQPNFYLAGPPAMQAAFNQGLLASGIPAEQVHQDAWE